MLTFFPKPYPDELLYSIVARYHVWSGNYEISDTMEELFGYRLEKATLLIPIHLKRLAEKTKDFGLNYKTLLYEHTIFPLVSCLLNEASFNKKLDIINNIEHEEKSLFMHHNRLYDAFLKYCPLCIKEDRKNYGEAYWHRRHQAYGVDVCSKHRCHLRVSCIETVGNTNCRYKALEILNDFTDNIEQEDISVCKIEMQIAYDVDFIYENYEYVRNIMWEKHSSMPETTKAILFKRGLVASCGYVKFNQLRIEFQDMYSSIKLKQFMIDINDNKKFSWLAALCRGQITVVLIRFILFAEFLADSLESYTKLINEQEQFIALKKEMRQKPKEYEKKIVQYRRRWLDVLEKNPNVYKVELKEIDRPAFSWLRRHDHEWLLNNSPQIYKPSGGVVIFNYWGKIDNELESMVDDVVLQIRNLNGKPVRINKTNISHYMKKKKMIAHNYRSLPKTMYKIQQYNEGINDYRLRKIEWAKS